jgi:hypothetical protein
LLPHRERGTHHLLLGRHCDAGLKAIRSRSRRRLGLRNESVVRDSGRRCGVFKLPLLVQWLPILRLRKLPLLGPGERARLGRAGQRGPGLLLRSNLLRAGLLAAWLCCARLRRPALLPGRS